MRTIVLAVLVLTVALSVAVSAEAPVSSGARGVGRQAFANRLDLTVDQIQQITDIRKQLMTDIKGVRNSSIPRPEKVARVKELVGVATDAVFNVLTPEQRDKVTKAVIGIRLLRLPRAGAGAGFFPFLRDLDLTDAQKAQIKDVVTANATQMKAIREDTLLTPQEKVEKPRALRKATMDKILAILTPAQREKANAAAQKIGSGGGRGQGLRGTGSGAGRVRGTGKAGQRRLNTSGAARNGAAPAGDAELDVDALLN